MALRGILATVSRPVSVSLKEFLRTGRLGPIALGMTASEVEALLGGQGTLAAEPSVWAYGSIELHFSRRRIFMIYADHLDPIEGDDRLLVDSWVLREGVSRHDIEHRLNGEGLEHSFHWRKAASESESDFEDLVTAGGVTLRFKLEDDGYYGSPGLLSIHIEDMTLLP